MIASETNPAAPEEIESGSGMRDIQRQMKRDSYDSEGEEREQIERLKVVPTKL